ncbi:MAG TPA: HNH endonuclease [Desulfobacterales bacterium]|nr:HNH endonuclease [Desulfobacterales bacterium]HIP40385.1 HNH endonuclease [Desulfocapsa sulfexigens]
MEDHPSVGPSKPFTQAQKRNILTENKAKNNGVIRSDLSGARAVQAQQHTKGVTPPPNDAHIDHIVPRSKGGTNSYSNAQVLTREENLKKGTK